jgi:hypothetical protein
MRGYIMRGVCSSVAAALLFVSGVSVAQQPMDASKSVAGGGISVPGWAGMVDAKEAEAGMTVQSAKFAKEGEAIHVTTGPAIVYWNPANKATGAYTVRATFT